MVIQWSEQAIRWFHDASAYTGYDKELAALLRPYIRQDGTLCDIGCGTGLVDLELAPCCSAVTCVDISQMVLDSLDGKCREAGIQNLKTVCMDGTELRGEWDTVMALFHGGKQRFDKYFRLASEYLLLATHTSGVSKTGPENRRLKKWCNEHWLTTYLNDRGFVYTLQETELEYGQPLRSIEDGAAYLKAYALPMSEEEAAAYLSGHLQETGDEQFPYYLPKKRNLSLFVIRKDENRHIE